MKTRGLVFRGLLVNSRVNRDLLGLRDSLINEQKQPPRNRGGTWVVPPPPPPLPPSFHPSWDKEREREARKQIKAAVERRHPVLVGRLGNALIFRPRVFNPPRSPFPRVINGSTRCLAAKISTTRPVIPPPLFKKATRELREHLSGDAFFVPLPGTPVRLGGETVIKKKR